MRWQKLSITLGAIFLMLIGLVFINYSGVNDIKFAELCKAFAAFCSAVGTIAIAAIVGNVGEHWKPAVSAVVNKLTGVQK